jgi:hypothetical protein
MLLGARFERAGAVVEPFARAPWPRDPARGRPAHLDVLGGEFAAVPFGSAGLPGDAGGGWAALGPAEPPALPHGFAANADWTVLAADDRSIRLACDDPVDPVVRRLERTVALRTGDPGIDVELVVHARRPGAAPIGLHPVLRLPDAPASLALEVPFDVGFTYPGTVPPGAGAALPGQRFSSLDAVPGPAGPVDLSRLPLDRPVEDVLLLTGVRGPVVARFGDDGTGVVLDWDRTVLPSVLLWISDRALGGDPWEHRYRGLGVEPVAAAFDLPPAVSAAPNPLAAAGVPTAVRLEPGRPLVVRSSIVPIFREP